jgi:FkbM family methyltransferase
MPLDQAFVLLKDLRVDPGAERLLRACAGTGFHGMVASANLTPQDCRLVISSRDWPDLAQRALVELAPERIVILLHLDHDPHGYWDFALGGDGGPGLGDSLANVIASRTVDAASFAAVARHADYWMASRTRSGRISAGAYHIMAHYPEVIARNADSLVRILAGLADQKSRDALTLILFGTAEQILHSYVSEVFGPQQYMDVIRFRPGDTIINGGIETGWELPYFIACMQGCGQIHCFDPIFQIAGRWAEPTTRAFADMLTNHEVALVETDGPVRLAVEPGFGTAYPGRKLEALSGAGLSVCEYQGRSLDSLVAEGKVGPFTMVKLDVEGGELAALRGMASSLLRYRPRLAVAIYHEPEHFFDIPDYLMKLLPDYRFYVRQYSCGRFETLLYAVPTEDGASRSGLEYGPMAASTRLGLQPPVTVSVYLQDDAPRATHKTKAIKQLDRAHGSAWALVHLAAAARVDGLLIVSVTETEQSGHGHVVAMRTGAKGRDAIFVGTLATPPALTWIASREVAEGSCVPVVGCPPAMAIIAEHIAADDALYVYRLGAGVTEGVTIIRALGVSPLALHQGATEGTVRMLARAGERFVLLEMALEGGAERREICAMPASDMRFLAVCEVTDHAAQGGKAGYGYLFGDPNLPVSAPCMTVLVPADNNEFLALRTLDWPCPAPVSTGKAGLVPLSWPPRR